MPDIQRNPLYVYDEPSVYDEFTGGINTDPSNENLRENELRDALNFHYDNRTIRTRYGASKHLDISYTEDLSNIQGIFLYTKTHPYIILAANGFLYYGLYQEGAQVKIDKLPIRFNATQSEDFKYLDQLRGIPVKEFKEPRLFHKGYVLNNSGSRELVFQNMRKIEAFPYDNQLFIATGTRFIRVYSEGDNVFAEIITPYEVNGFEVQQIGPNLLSPFPNLCLKHSTQSVKTSIHGVIPILKGNVVQLQTIMSYDSGKSADDYYFKWEKIIVDSKGEGRPEPVFSYPDNFNSMLIFKSTDNGKPLTKGLNSIVVSKEDAENYRYRVTFAEKFSRDYTKEGAPLLTEVNYVFAWKDSEGNVFKNELEEEIFTYEDYIPDKLNGWIGSATSILLSDELTKVNSDWEQIQSCTKIIGDGNKIILYGDDYNSGNWYKSIIDNPAYFTYRGGLNFKTIYNEQLTKVINFKGVIVCFAYNKFLGGSISIVIGNGDDYPDEGYSPYAKKVVNQQISTDNPDTVQIADNMILFKLKQTVYMIEGSQLNSEILSVQSVNSSIIQKSKDVYIPWDDPDCISEITSDYYALIWKEKAHLDLGEVLKERKGTRVKMYYRLGKYEDNRIVFPWLRDESDTFNIEHIIYIEGVPYHLYDNNLICYTKRNYKDLNKSYLAKLSLRGYNLNYPKFLKSLNRLSLYYYRGQKNPVELDIQAFNEASYPLFPDADIIKHTPKPGSIKLDSSYTDVSILTSKLRIPCLLCYVDISIKNDDDFSLASIAFDYRTKGLPKTSPYDSYKKYSSKGESLRRRSK